MLWGLEAIGKPFQQRLSTAKAIHDLARTAAGERELHVPFWALTAEEFKSDARRRIERDGYRIITSIGDQLSDSTGGHVIRGFRLPNPMYFLP